MMVIVTRRAPPRLRGRLAVYLLEVRAGVYVGNYDRRTRERIWETVVQAIGDGDAVLCWTASCEAGFEVRTTGHNRREPIDADGTPLVRFLPLAEGDDAG